MKFLTYPANLIVVFSIWNYYYEMFGSLLIMIIFTLILTDIQIMKRLIEKLNSKLNPKCEYWFFGLGLSFIAVIVLLLWLKQI